MLMKTTHIIKYIFSYILVMFTFVFTSSFEAYGKFVDVTALHDGNLYVINIEDLTWSVNVGSSTWSVTYGNANNIVKSLVGNYYGRYFEAEVTKIQEGAFKNSNQQSNLVIPSWIRFIGSSAFSGCDICDIIISGPIDAIHTQTFKDCFNLESITLPNTVKVIDNLAFYSCI